MILKPPLFAKPIHGHPLGPDGGLAGCWLMNEGRYNSTFTKVFDLSGNGTIFDDWTNSPIWVPGGLDFENAVATQWITSNSPTISAIGTGNYTLILGLKVESYNPSNGAVFTFGLYDPAWSLDSSGHPYIYDGGNKTASSGVVPLGTNSVIAYVRTGIGAGELNYYINGVAAGTAQHVDSINAPSTVTFASDRDGTSSYDYDGVIRFGYLYNRGLSSSEVAQLYREPFCMFDYDPIELWSAATQGGAPAGTILPQITTAYMRVTA